MGSEDNTRLQSRIPERLKKILDDFLKEKKLNQAEFFQQYLPVLLMAIDRDLFMKLFEKYYRDTNLEELINKKRK